VQFSGVESLVVQRRLHVCCSISDTVIIPVLKSVARKQILETATD
jgi:hypothetical protein